MANSFRPADEIIEAGTFHKGNGGKMNNIILIHKEAGTKKDAFRLRKEQDIPSFLRKAKRVLVTQKGAKIDR